MTWLQDVLKENRLAVASWPEWKRRAGMSNEMAEAETCGDEVGRLRAENAKLKAELAQAKVREVRLMEVLQMLVDRNENSVGGLADWDDCWDDAKQVLKEQP